MTNEERRIALGEARRKALAYATEAEGAQFEDPERMNRLISFANMWARIANALKVGDPTGPDATDGVPSDGTIITR